MGTVLDGVRGKVFLDRYSLKSPEGKPVEQTPEEMWRRVARGIAAVERTPELRAHWEEEFYRALEDFRFVPGGRVLSSAGTGFETTYYNCFVIPSPEDSRGGILDNLKILTEIMARGGGVGVNLSTLRPRGSYIKTVNGTASGPVSWAELYSVITGDVIQQGGSRRGALMVMLDDDHPDVMEFIHAKKIDPLTNRPVAIEHANISVAVSDAFMEAVKADADWPTQFPTKAMVAAEPALAAKVTPGPTFRAREIWRTICASAWATAEPGVVFTDRYNAWNNTWYYQTIRCTNPCFVGSTRLATERGLLTMEELYREQVALRVVTDARAAGEAKQVVGGQPLPSLGTVLRPATPVFKTREQTPVYRLVTTHGYEVTATPDHRFLTPAGYVELQHLEPGDVLYLQSGAGGWSEDEALPPVAYTTKGAGRLQARVGRGTAEPPARWSREIGHFLGWLSGDGYAYRHGDHGRINLVFGRDEAALLPYFRGLLRGWFGVAGVANTRHNTTNLSYEGVPATFAEALGIQPGKAHEKRAPASIWRAPREAVVGYLQALFTSDGTVNVSCYGKSCSIRLASSSEGLLKDAQLLLLNLGLASRIYRRREARTHLLPGADRELRAYETQAQFELILDKSNRDLFLEEIGFLTSAKQEKCQAYIESKVRPSNRELFVTRVAHIEPAGQADVYDLTEETTHSIVANGLVVHQCGEQGISPWSVCNLAALNLSSFVSGPIGAGAFDYEALAHYARVGLRFSDNVIDANRYFIPENADEQLGTRRTGLGTMGLADALITMGVRYGSPESEPIVERIYRTIRDAAYDESVTLAIEKGSFPRFERDKYAQGQFIRTLPGEIQARIQQHGIRNAVLLTQAPTGTTSLLAGVSSGIEPVFDFAYRRVDRTGESLIYHPLLKRWMDEHPGEERADYFVGANDLTPEDHIRVQAMVQKYTDSSISKCVTGDTLIASERGLLPIADLYAGEAPDSFRSLGLRVASLTGEQVAVDFYYGGIRPTLKVQLADGHEIIGTPNHRLLVGTVTGLAWKRLDELIPGDHVALKVGTQRFGADVSLRGFQQSTTRAGYQKTITVPPSMQPMLAHFLGAVTAEGCLAHYTVRITDNERAVLDRLAAEAQTLFGLTGVIAPMGRSNALTLSLNSKSLCELLRFLGYVDGAAEKVIPWSILQSSRESQVAFLSGLYLDGYVRPGKIGICLASRALISQLQIVLDNLSVQSWMTAKHNAVYDRDYYELNVHGQEAQRLARILTFDEAHKIERAQALLRREFAWSKTDIIPIEARHSIFASASSRVRMRHHGYSQEITATNPDRQLSWFGLRRLANDPEVPLTDDLRRVVDENLHFRRVLAVTEGGAQAVYDIAVPATEAFVANGIVNHNTCNAPNSHTVEEVERLYLMAYESGCKGVTYYRDGSRDAVLHHIDDKQAEAPTTGAAPAPAPVIDKAIRPLPAIVQGYTRKMQSPEGKVNITLNSDEGGLLEVFVNVGRAGSDIAALAEALGRLISLIQRLPSPLTPDERAQFVVNQLRGIGGSRTVGFGLEQVRSLPDAIGLALQKHLEGQVAPAPARAAAPANQPALPGLFNGGPHLTGNLCPECGSTAFVFEEGCKKCHACGYSEC